MPRTRKHGTTTTLPSNRTLLREMGFWPNDPYPPARFKTRADYGLGPDQRTNVNNRLKHALDQLHGKYTWDYLRLLARTPAEAKLDDIRQAIHWSAIERAFEGTQPPRARGRDQALWAEEDALARANYMQRLSESAVDNKPFDQVYHPLQRRLTDIVPVEGWDLKTRVSQLIKGSLDRGKVHRMEYDWQKPIKERACYRDTTESADEHVANDNISTAYIDCGHTQGDILTWVKDPCSADAGFDQFILCDETNGILENASTNAQLDVFPADGIVDESCLSGLSNVSPVTPLSNYLVSNRQAWPTWAEYGTDYHKDITNFVSAHFHPSHLQPQPRPPSRKRRAESDDAFEAAKPATKLRRTEPPISQARSMCKPHTQYNSAFHQASSITFHQQSNTIRSQKPNKSPRHSSMRMAHTPSPTPRPGSPYYIRATMTSDTEVVPATNLAEQSQRVNGALLTPPDEANEYVNHNLLKESVEQPAPLNAKAFLENDNIDPNLLDLNFEKPQSNLPSQVMYDAVDDADAFVRDNGDFFDAFWEETAIYVQTPFSDQI